MIARNKRQNQNNSELKYTAAAPWIWCRRWETWGCCLQTSSARNSTAEECKPFEELQETVPVSINTYMATSKVVLSITDGQHHLPPPMVINYWQICQKRKVKFGPFLRLDDTDDYSKWQATYDSIPIIIIIIIILFILKVHFKRRKEKHQTSNSTQKLNERTCVNSRRIRVCQRQLYTISNHLKFTYYNYYISN